MDLVQSFTNFILLWVLTYALVFGSYLVFGAAFTLWSRRHPERKIQPGRDGQKRETPVFRRQTQNWTRRAAWRHLRQLAKHWPELYSAAAAANFYVNSIVKVCRKSKRVITWI